MQVMLAKTAGFCFGVDRAVSMVEQAVPGRPPCRYAGADHSQPACGGPL